jgi:hypothetical protein
MNSEELKQVYVLFLKKRITTVQTQIISATEPERKDTVWRYTNHWSLLELFLSCIHMWSWSRDSLMAAWFAQALWNDVEISHGQRVPRSRKKRQQPKQQAECDVLYSMVIQAPFWPQVLLCLRETFKLPSFEFPLWRIIFLEDNLGSVTCFNAAFRPSQAFDHRFLARSKKCRCSICPFDAGARDSGLWVFCFTATARSSIYKFWVRGSIGIRPVGAYIPLINLDGENITDCLRTRIRPTRCRIRPPGRMSWPFWARNALQPWPALVPVWHELADLQTVGGLASQLSQLVCSAWILAILMPLVIKIVASLPVLKYLNWGIRASLFSLWWEEKSWVIRSKA